MKPTNERTAAYKKTMTKAVRYLSLYSRNPNKLRNFLGKVVDGSTGITTHYTFTSKKKRGNL